jgi:hypothetical protein
MYELIMQAGNRGEIVPAGKHEGLRWRKLGTKPSGGCMARERRRTPRYVFIASAELYEEQTDCRVASRVSELSLHGCYLDMMNPFPTGTIILLKIFAGDMTFQAKARVVYYTPNVGAGVTFLDVEPKYEFMLHRWIEELEKTEKSV